MVNSPDGLILYSGALKSRIYDAMRKTRAAHLKFDGYWERPIDIPRVVVS